MLIKAKYNTLKITINELLRVGFLVYPVYIETSIIALFISLLL